MSKEFPSKNGILKSPFVMQTNELKTDLEKLMKLMEEIINE